MKEDHFVNTDRIPDISGNHLRSANLMKIQFANVRKLLNLIELRMEKNVEWIDHSFPILDNARIYITELCNSRCQSCNFWKIKYEAQLQTKTWIGILKQIRNMGISSIEFVGGEPTLRPDLPELIKNARGLGFDSIMISTNGLLLNDNYINQLVGCGLNSLRLSLDGLRDTYNYIRGVDGFEKVLQSLSSSAKAGVRTLVFTNLTRQVIDELEAVVDLVNGLSAYWSVNIIENMKYGFAGVNLEKIAITSHADIERVISILLKIKQKYPLNCMLQDTDILYIKDYLYDPLREKKVPCTLGFRDIYLDPRGNVYSACMSMNPVGNILEAQLSKIVQSQKMQTNLKAMILRRCGGCTCGYSQRAELMNAIPILK
jgi:MoaA/NifB/PqqE/SkfB family radical SAM enzyme